MMVKILAWLLVFEATVIGRISAFSVISLSPTSKPVHTYVSSPKPWFVPGIATTATPSSPRTSLSLSSSPNNDDKYSHGRNFLQSRTDIRYFLTQRSIQSFVCLLNRCREEHNVRWLEKTLNFSSIDNFHGTGAFNRTRFPEWDSIFLHCVDRPEEVTVIQMRQRRRQQRLSGYNAYFESLKPANQRLEANTTDSKSLRNENPKAKRSSFSVGNYLESMNTPANQTQLTEKKSYKPMFNTKATTETNERLSSASNYLENLSATPSSDSHRNTKDAKSDHAQRIQSLAKDIQAQNGTTLWIVKNETLMSSSLPKSINATKQRFGIGKGTSYLETLSIAGTDTGGSSKITEDGEDEKTKQTIETSKNPFLEEKSREYELIVDPPALVRRILSVREQISKEWVEDLDMLMKLNDEIAETFDEFNNANAKVYEDDEEEENDDINRKHDKDFDEGRSTGDMEDLMKAFGVFIDTESVSQGSSSDASSSEVVDKNQSVNADIPKRRTIFDRDILNSWTQLLWSPKRSSSPYRKANFDLLLLLSTQESVHRVLKAYKDGDIRSEVHDWLLDYYTDNVSDYFDGHQTYARSEDFLEEMTKLPRTLIETKSSKTVAWIDPSCVAEDIVRERSEVILEWMRIAETIPDEHTDLRRLLFTNMVSKSVPEEGFSGTLLGVTEDDSDEAQIREIPKKDISSSSTEIFGAFE